VIIEINKKVHLDGSFYATKLYHDSRSTECQTPPNYFVWYGSLHYVVNRVFLLRVTFESRGLFCCYYLLLYYYYYYHHNLLYARYLYLYSWDKLCP